MQTKKTLPVFDTLQFGWKKFAERPWFYIGIVLVAIVISAISSFISQVYSQYGLSWFMSSALSLADIAVQVLVVMGMIKIFLIAHEDADKAKIKDMWAPNRFWVYLGSAILAGIAVVAGFLMLVLPGVLFVLLFMFVPYVVMDTKKGAIESMRESWHIAQDHLLALFGLAVLLILLNAAGMALAGIGLLVTVPMSQFALIEAYRTLQKLAD